MQLYDNPFLEIFIPLVIGLFLPLSFVNITFLTISQAPLWFLIPYMAFILMLLINGYRLVDLFGILCYGYFGFLFILHQSILSTNAPNYPQAFLYLGIFIVLGILQGKYRYQFTLMLIGAVGAISILYAQPNLGLIGAITGVIVGLVISRITMASSIVDRLFQYVAALVTTIVAIIIISILLPIVLLHTPVLFVIGMVSQVIFINRGISKARLAESNKTQTVEKLNSVADPKMAQRAILFRAAVRLIKGYQIFVKVASPIVTLMLVVYLTFTAKSVGNALIFPLPTSIQTFMDEFSSYTAAFSIHTSSNVKQPDTYYYARFDGGVDVISCPRVTCSVMAHYPPGWRLESITLVKGDAVNNVQDWVEVLEHAQLGYINVANTHQETFSIPLLKPTPTPQPNKKK